MSKKKEPKEEDRVEVVLVDLPEPHRGKIPREVIFRAVQKVVGERRKREAEEAAAAKVAAESRETNASEAP